MAALDLAKSAFSHIKALVFEAPAMADSAWQLHAASRITSLSKAAVVAVVMSLDASGLAQAFDFPDELKPDPVIAAEIAEAQKVSDIARAEDEKRQARQQRRLADVTALYKKAADSPKDVQAWQSLRPNLKMFSMYNGVDSVDGRSLAEKAGMSAADFGSDKTQLRVDTVDAAIKNVAPEAFASGAAFVVPSSFFKTAEKPAGAVCIVSFNAHIAEKHQEIKEATQWSDDVIADLVVRHERTHCIESTDRANHLVKKLMNPAIEVGELITAKSIENIDGLLPFLVRAPATEHIHEQHRVALAYLNSLLPLKQHTGPILDGEEIADAVALLSLIKESRLDVADITDFANYRLNLGLTDQEHETSSMLFNMQHQLELNPALVAQWRKDYAREYMQGKGIQVADQIAWVQPLWKAHSQVRDDDNAQVARVAMIPGYH